MLKIGCLWVKSAGVFAVLGSGKDGGPPIAININQSRSVENGAWLEIYFLTK
jgi:hypothetical protein